MSLLDEGNRIVKIRALSLARVIAALDAGDAAALDALGATFARMMPPEGGDFLALVARARLVREWRSPRMSAQIAALDSAIVEWRADRAGQHDALSNKEG